MGEFFSIIVGRIQNAALLRASVLIMIWPRHIPAPGKVGAAFFDPLPEEELAAWEESRGLH